jgi:anti-sigma B factor antagonist
MVSMHEHDMHEHDGSPVRQASADRTAKGQEPRAHQQVPAQPRVGDVGKVPAPRQAPETHLDVRVRLAPALPVIRLRGELDLSNVHLLRDALESVQNEFGVGELVVLDLAGLEFCDANGVAMINHARITMAMSGKELVLRDPPSSLRKLLAITGLEHEFKEV